MVSCLTLVSNVHALAGQQHGFSHTACGLAIASEHIRDGMFATSSDQVSCASCLQAAAAAARPSNAGELPADPKALVTRLVGVLNAQDSQGLAQCFGGRLAADFTPGRLARLHEMFPGWRAEIDELIAERETVVLRYHVTCVDAFGLFQLEQANIERDQTVIFRLSEQRVVDVSAIVDDFGLWQNVAPPAYVARCACHPDAPANFQCTTQET